MIIPLAGSNVTITLATHVFFNNNHLVPLFIVPRPVCLDPLKKITHNLKTITHNLKTIQKITHNLKRAQFSIKEFFPQDSSKQRKLQYQPSCHNHLLLPGFSWLQEGRKFSIILLLSSSSLRVYGFSLSSLINFEAAQTKKNNKERNLTKGLCCCTINVAKEKNKVLQADRKEIIKSWLLSYKPF